MYKVMVVDDESLGRKSVCKMISELALDVEVIAEARHGEEALELIRISKPHIIVTDMNMPVMNGQQFLEALYTNYAEIKVIVISGYSQFEYMKAAVTYQACEYVLKPISLLDLKSALVKAMEASHNHLTLQQQKKFTQDMWQLRREVFFQHVTSRRITNVIDIQTQAEELAISSARGSFRLAVCMFRNFHDISIKKFHGNADLLMYSIENILAEVLSFDGQDVAPLIYKSDDRMSLCLYAPEFPYNETHIRHLLTSFHNVIKQMLQLDVVAGLSRVYTKFEQLPEAYDMANDHLRNNALHATHFSLNAPEQLPGAAPAAWELLTVFELKTLQQAFAAGNGGESRELLRNLLHKADKMSGLTIREGQRALKKLTEMAAAEMSDMVIVYPQLFDARSLAGIVDHSQFSLFIEQFSEATEEYHASKGTTPSVHSMHEIAAYLDAHYFEDISLIDIATRFHLDPSYLSKQFKSVTSENFIEYVTRKRMEKSCELLHMSEYKISEISELVGYENQRYFSQVFKKFTGQTPSEYREKYAAKTKLPKF
ncbi:Protein-glutamate methylesterase/protein-glutamine glutaminase [Paenibacillus allorhizoplanae]|uniref:Protein-glutamate methylesterase/protein-glutamine glutaminase n=1 Tax=Paenibacillus allorhizoplanae TaxID=2905648 RepID=A0ABN8GLD4_9BACL|nr:response regulator [Paenibacillus allorhizoplanae]CAH1211936.1 Protein-glutamate methylesterase/protein-glutamine glutaminase [Paenibacillus allorhizoplanae]